MVVKKIFKNNLKLLVNKLEIDIVRKRKINYKKNFDLSQLDLSSINIIHNIKLRELITTAGKKLGSKEDPYYRALYLSLPIQNKQKFIKSFIREIKLIVNKPRNASDAIGIKNTKLARYPEWSLVLPWDNISIEDNYSSYLKKFISKRNDIKNMYLKTSKKQRDYLIYHDLSWKSHAEQFFSLYRSISQKGFQETNLVPVNLFKFNNSYRFSLSDDGNHRVRTVFVLGIKSIPLKISKVIDFDSIDNWTNVKNKLYSKKEAKKIFIDYFNYSGKGAYV